MMTIVTDSSARELFTSLMLNRCHHYSHVGEAFDWIANAVHHRYPTVSTDEVHQWIRERNTDPTHTCWERKS